MVRAQNENLRRLAGAGRMCNTNTCTESMAVRFSIEFNSAG
jgi:hypothetical protein